MSENPFTIRVLMTAERKNILELATFAYHNCEFRRAIDFVLEQDPDAAFAELHLKALSELDQHGLAIQWAETYLKTFPRSGALHYFAGIARYLGGHPLSGLVHAFEKSVELGYLGGHLGLGFTHFAERKLNTCLDHLNAARELTPEMDHIRCLMIFQVHACTGMVTEAEQELEQADRVLRKNPSLLRHLWGHLCWARLMQAKGDFLGAKNLLLRTLPILSPETTPRLHRNARESLAMIEGQCAEQRIIMPPSDVELAPSSIGRKPMLRSLYLYLKAAGPLGASKEAIVKNVWSESYNPEIHDDRIYKTVARLRKLIGDDLDCPKQLVQTGRHYTLNGPSNLSPSKDTSP